MIKNKETAERERTEFRRAVERARKSYAELIGDDARTVNITRNRFSRRGSG